MKSSVTQLVELAPALEAVLGAEAVLTEDAQLDAYTADTYWPAIHARAAGTPLGRPDVVAVPRREEDVASILRIASDAPRARRRLGRRLGHPGRRGGDQRRARRGPARAGHHRRDRRRLDDRDGAGRRQRQRARAGAQRAGADAAALPGQLGVGHGRRLRGRARLRRALHPLRQDRGPGARLRVALPTARCSTASPPRDTRSDRTSRSSSSARRARSGSSPAPRSRSSRSRPSAASSPCTSRPSRPA